MPRKKAASERLNYYLRKLGEYGARLEADRNYDEWGWRRYRLNAYRNRVYKLLNCERMRELRAKYGRGNRQ
ncbi:hypothetical protein PDUR_18305 [Paenibacillus durus]|uniref:Uncharacterized protein n=2 Tax=Paenibacillus durus TaxID=44251 RepID=A0A089IXG3_PAEDU|nr:hypothetical protein PDUR_18305 [Paenibacillus durus]